MLTLRQLAILRASLRYWQEEICPHGDMAARPYLDSDQITPLSADEVNELRDRFNPQAVRYAMIAPDRNRLEDTTLFAGAEQAASLADNDLIATVIMPGV